MSQPIIQRTILASAISIAIASPYAMAVPDQLPITNMQFGSTVYNAGGFFNLVGTVGPFDPNIDLVPDPSIPPPDTGRMLAPGFDPLIASGNIFSFDDFFAKPWEGLQQSAYLKNTDSYAFVYDKALSPASDPGNPALDPCSDPVDVTKSTGLCSSQGSYDFDIDLAGMTDEQIAVGIFFSWNNNTEIAVLEIFNCDANDNCTGNGVPMANGPFAGAIALFNAGLSCADGFVSTGKDTPVSVGIVSDVLGTDTPPSNCTNPTDPVDPTNPVGLKVDSAISPTSAGGTAIINGSVIDYTPAGGFEGSDSFIVNVSDDTGLATSLTFKIQVGGQLQSNFSMMDRSGNIFGGTNDVDIGWDETSFNASTLDAMGIPTDLNFDGVMTMHSSEPFFNFTWNSHHVRIFKNETAAPVTYNFDVTCRTSDYDAGIVDCDRPLAEQKAITRFMTLTLQPGEIGNHILFDWGKDDATTECGQANCAIDVVNLLRENVQWDKHGATGNKNVVWIGPAGVPPATVENSGEGASWRLVSDDVNGDGINASPMVDGAFEGSYSNFSYKPDTAGTALPPFTGKISDVDIDGFSFSLWTLFAGFFSVLGLRRFTGEK